MTEMAPGEIEEQFGPMAEQLHGFTQQLPTDGQIPAVELAALVGETSHLAAYLLRNIDKGEIDSARHNLQIFHDTAERLVTAARAALADCNARLPRLHGRCLAKVNLQDAERGVAGISPVRR